MSMEIEKGVVDFDDSIAMWLEQYRSALLKIKEYEEIADVARSRIEAALGDAQTGLYKGQEVVRWTNVTSTRFDVKRAKEILPPQVLDLLQVQNTTRRFSLVSNEEQ
jgi:predicted phage-related endonuclease